MKKLLKHPSFLLFGIVLLIFPFQKPFYPAIPSQVESTPPARQESPQVIWVYYTTPAQLAELAAHLDIWEVHSTEGYLVAAVSESQITFLNQRSYRFRTDPAKTALLRAPLQLAPGQTSGVPGFPCYRTVEETNSAMNTLAQNHSDLAEWKNIGSSWEKITPGGASGYDIPVLVLTNHANPFAEKPKIFIMAEIHAREMTTSETAARLAEDLVDGYGVDPDITALLDFNELHIVPMTNPDGRKLAEQGGYDWRKNTNNTNGCQSSSTWGTDLNRNFNFKWGEAGASTWSCDEIYQGPTPVSEPETQAIQNYVRSLFPDRRGPGDNDPAPADTPGVLITLHSYGNDILYPWGWTNQLSPNDSQLKTFGRKMAYFNQYVTKLSYALYPTSGTTDDWSYGELGVASYTFEMGNWFFEQCPDFNNLIYPDNRDALLYAAKAAFQPYQAPSGPDTNHLQVTSTNFYLGAPLSLSARADDTRFYGGGASQNIQSARFSLDSPPWLPGVSTTPLSAEDGSFNETIENLVASVPTAGMTPGRHTLFVQSQDAAGNWGVPGAIFIDLAESDEFSFIPAGTRHYTTPGEQSEYTLTISNRGGVSDTYAIALSNSIWPAQLSTDSIGPLAPQTSASFTLEVTAPPTATAGMANHALIEVTSGKNSLRTVSAQVDTLIPGYGIDVAPTISSRFSHAGREVVHTYHITNTGNITDSFEIVLDNSQWPVFQASTNITIPFESSLSYQITVTIPTAAPVGFSDSARFTASSSGDSAKSINFEASTLAVAPIFIPLIPQFVNTPTLVKAQFYPDRE